MLASRPTDRPLDDALTRARDLGLDEWLAARTSALSTGTARKLWYLMCTLGSFDVLLLDEPFNGVDEHAVSIMCDEVAEWAASSLVLVVCHVRPPMLSIDRAFSLQAENVVR